MAESDSSTNKETPDPVPPNRADDIDWRAISDQLNKLIQELPNAIKYTADQPPKAHWSQVIGSICSVIALLSTALLAFLGYTYLYRQQGLTNIKLSLAHIKVDTKPDSECIQKMNCLAVFEITNQGPAFANNVVIDVILHDVSDAWRVAINDMKKFNVFTSPPSTKVSPPVPMDVNEPSSFNKVVRFNEYVLAINDLPPGRSVTIELTSAIPVAPVSFNLNTKLYIFSPSSQGINFGSSFPILKVIQTYFDKLFSIAEFVVNTSCDNCDNTDQQTISASSLEDAQLQVSLNPLDPLDSVWAGPLQVTYEWPKNSKPLQISNPLNLWTQPENPTTPLDPLTQSYLGTVTLCGAAGQTGSQNTCTPSSSTGS